MMFLKTKAQEFPEFEIIKEEVYQLDMASKDDDDCIARGEELLEKRGMPVSDYVVRQKEDFYGLYIR